MMPRLLSLLALLCVSAACTACGAKGPLIKPTGSVPPPLLGNGSSGETPHAPASPPPETH
jgi:predicted small lipoprotein YifL